MSDTSRGSDNGDVDGDAIDRPQQLLDDYLSDTELADELGVSPRTIQRWRRLGEGPPLTKIGKKNATRRGGARDWLRAREEALDA